MSIQKLQNYIVDYMLHIKWSNIVFYDDTWINIQLRIYNITQYDF